MARRKDDEAGRGLGEALRPLWHRAGEPSFRSIERALVADLGVETAPSAEQVRRMHHGETDPWTCSVEALLGLAGSARSRCCHPVQDPRRHGGSELEDSVPRAARRRGVMAER